MTSVQLRLGPLGAPGLVIRRSGFRFLRPDGYQCAPGEAIAYCNITLESAGTGYGASLLSDERELQVALAPGIGGRLKLNASASLGGYLDFQSVATWTETEVIAEIDVAERVEIDIAAAGELRSMVIAGRRMTGLADVHSGLMPGWHSRCRAWWGGNGDDMLTLLSMGICDATGVIRGDQFAFLELFEATSDPTHVVFVADCPVMPSARLVLEQFRRSRQDKLAIRDDLLKGLATSSPAPTSADFFFAGALLNALETSPIADRYDVIADNAVRKALRPQAVLLSLTAEPQTMLRHKELGYALALMGHHRIAAGPAMSQWLKARFDPVKRTMDDIGSDYASLFDALSGQSGAHFLVLNAMSSSGREDISTYASFDLPLSASLANVAAKRLNLVLEEAAAGRAVSIIDVDGIAAAIGGGQHIPDGMHQSGPMQAAVRAELLAAIKPLRKAAQVNA